MSKKPNNKKFKAIIICSFLFVVSAVYLLLVSNNLIDEPIWNEIFINTHLSERKNDNRKTVVESFEGMEVHFLDVGNADCSYIKCGDSNILIDAGDKEPQGLVVDYLKNQGVENLNLVVATHPHRDHIGQMTDVMENFKVDKFIEPEVPDDIVPTTITYEKMLRTIAKHNIDAELVKDGYNISIGDLNIESVGPISRNSKNLNNNSIVLRITYKDVKFLFTGDAETNEEKEILGSGREIKSDVLKVAHHGSGTSTTVKFLKAVSPKYAVISVSKEKYQSNKSKVPDRLKKFCGDNNVYVTGKDGTIVVFTDGKNIELKKSA